MAPELLSSRPQPATSHLQTPRRCFPRRAHLPGRPSVLRVPKPADGSQWAGGGGGEAPPRPRPLPAVAPTAAAATGAGRFVRADGAGAPEFRSVPPAPRGACEGRWTRAGGRCRSSEVGAGKTGGDRLFPRGPRKGQAPPEPEPPPRPLPPYRGAGATVPACAHPARARRGRGGVGECVCACVCASVCLSVSGM